MLPCVNLNINNSCHLASQNQMESIEVIRSHRSYFLSRHSVIYYMKMESVKRDSEVWVCLHFLCLFSPVFIIRILWLSQRSHQTKTTLYRWSRFTCIYDMQYRFKRSCSHSILDSPVQSLKRQNVYSHIAVLWGCMLTITMWNADV